VLSCLVVGDDVYAFWKADKTVYMVTIAVCENDMLYRIGCELFDFRDHLFG